MRYQAETLLACDFIETVTLTGQRQYILAVIEHANRRIRILGTTGHPTAGRVAQAIKNLVMDLENAGCRARYLIRDRDGKFPALIDDVLADASIQTVLCGNDAEGGDPAKRPAADALTPTAAAGASDRCCAARRPYWPDRCSEVGSSTRNVVAWPGSLSTSTVPACAVTIAATIAKPSPVPVFPLVRVRAGSAR